MGEFEPGWSVEKIKLVGADAVKLLAPFEPTEMISAEHNLAFIQEVANDCRKNDILFLLEPVAFPIGNEKKTDKSFLDRKAKTTIESARQLSAFCDVYKAEFPGTLEHESNEQLKDNLHALSAASVKPWVLLSAGVKYDQYKKQVEMAMRAGASGILGGRAFWTEFFTFKTPAERQQFAETECVKRVRESDAIVKSGTPWFAKYGLTTADLHGMRATDGWHARYGGGGTTAGPAGKVDPTAVY